MSASYQPFVNGTWDHSALSDWQRLQLADVDSVSEAECLLQTWLNFTYNDTIPELFCNATWDYFYCWPRTPVDTAVEIPCSDIFSKAESQFSIRLEGQVTRTCLGDGSWSQGGISNYKECATSLMLHLQRLKDDDTLLLLVQYMLFIGSVLSLFCLGIALSIYYLYFRCLRCDRVTVQAHLMVSLVFRFILMFIISEPHVLGHSNSYRDVDFLCESILVGFLYFTFSSVSWMFIQGLYLNITLMTGVVNSIARYQLLFYYFVGWGVPAVFVFAFVISMLLKEQERCWTGYSDMDEMWILLCPIIFEVVVNGIFLMNILRILLRKVRNSHSRPDSSQIKAAAKATAILFPVLGVNNLLLLYNPGGEYSKYFVALNTFFGSTQGIFVALVYCFTNKEVWTAVKRSFERRNTTRNLNGASGSENRSRARVSPQTMIEFSTRYQQPSLDTNFMEQEIEL